ncbi:hypothetical protein VJ923_02700 [Adlercreutzia sp. R25]|uniref:hypothetical protein n=1 Tax=Adlercreutzia shanghongiae TaxID=3111773 RepID=UPI002DB5BB67|nr:hypothetical protein [Adlercreutzia sp. R25]MEC4272068.1 hypothetical protein [Adlercreutzia sp. R25]
MNAFSRSFANNASMAKKVVACSVAAALVASMSYFHLWGAPQAVADDTTVEVRFEIAQAGVKAKVGDKEFTSQTEESYQASTSADLNFTIEAENSDTEFAVSYVTEAATAAPEAQAMGSKQPGSGLVTAEEGENESEASEVEASDDLAEGDSADESADQEPIATEEGIIYVEGAGAPISETAAALQKKHEQESANDEKHAPATQNAEEEVVEEDATPMASGVNSVEADDADQQATVHAAAIVAKDGTYTIEEAVLQQAGADNALVVVTIATTDSKQGNVSSWEDLVEILTGHAGTNEAVLHEDIKVTTGTIAIDGTKTLDLNGHNITVESTGSLFTVGDGANFTITDSREGAKAVTVPNKPNNADKEESTLDGTKLPNPADNPGAFKKMVGKTATYGVDENGDLLLNYYKTISYPDMPAKGQTEEYVYEYTLKLPAKGAIEARGTSNLVDVQKNGILSIEGGRLTQTDGESAIKVNEGKVVVSGGFLVGSRGESGAAINATKADIAVKGDAIIAGNTAAGDNNNNGGAIYANKSKVTIEGEALFAGNKAGEAALQTFNETSFDSTCLGGAIYAEKGSTVTAQGNSVFSGNVAGGNGGAICLPDRLNTDYNQNTLVLAENVMLTNNRADNDKSASHTAGKIGKAGRGGGGAVFSGDKVTVDGATITGNFAADGGGGLMVTYFKYGYVEPLLQIESATISSNYAGTSEGGGIFARTSYKPGRAIEDNSYVKSGYVTNNMTATEFDYGGGGLFLEHAMWDSSKPLACTTGILVYHPLVTKNTARGFGGGVGVCTNGAVLSSDAAVFGNTALGENVTTNPNEYGDKWNFNLAKYEEVYGAEKKEELLESWGHPEWTEENYLITEPSESSDFYCAQDATVFGSMLGGGAYNWTGHTDGDISKGMIVCTRVDYNNAGNTISINGSMSERFLNMLYYSKNPAAEDKDTITLHAPKSLANQLKTVKGYGIDFSTIDLGNNKAPISGTAVIEDIKYIKETDSSYNEYLITLSDEPLPSIGLKKNPETTQEIKAFKDQRKFKVSVIEKGELAPENAAYVKASRHLALAAHPDDDAIAAAYAEARLFFTGNYSNTNGAGITSNDRIAVGYDFQAPGNPGDSKEPSSTSVAALQINKSLEGFNEANGSATAVFNVVGYRDKDAAERKVKDLEIYRNIVGFTFKAGEKSAEPRILEDIPEGWYVIEEISYSGDNFNDEQVAANKRIVQVKGVTVAIEAGKTEPSTEDLEKARKEALENAEKNRVEFKNVYSKVPHYGTGVVNHYSKDDDGKFSYTPDANYADRTRELTTEEGM